MRTRNSRFPNRQPAISIFGWAIMSNFKLPAELLRRAWLPFSSARIARRCATIWSFRKRHSRTSQSSITALADVLARIQEAVDQVALVIRFLAFFAIAAGAIILSASIAGTRYRRIREVAVLKTLGATRSRVISIFSIEFSILGAIGGFVGGVLANLFTRVICDRFLDFKFEFDWASLLVVMAGTALLANLAGWLASARILDQRPLEVLRGE